MSGRSLQLRAVVASALAILLALVVGGAVVDVLVERNVIRGNRGAGLQGRGDVNLVVVPRGNDLNGNSGGAVRGLRLRG